MEIKSRLIILTKWIFLRIGLVISRSNYYTRDDIRLLRFLEVNEIDTVLDVGANTGEYAATLLEGGFQGRVYSFEPLPDLHEKLVQRAAAVSDRWIVAPRCAISDSRGIAKFNVTKASSSSSLLKPAETANQMPDIFEVCQNIEVPTETVAFCLSSLGITSNKIFLKLDIQGGEE